MKQINKFAFILFLVVNLISCTTTKTIEVPVEVPIISKEYITKTDSIYFKDSIYIHETMRNDTVFVTKDKYKYVYKTKTDTVCKTDTLTVLKTVTSTKEVKYVPQYYKNVNKIFWIMIICLLLFLLYKIRKYIPIGKS